MTRNGVRIVALALALCWTCPRARADAPASPPEMATPVSLPPVEARAATGPTRAASVPASPPQPSTDPEPTWCDLQNWRSAGKFLGGVLTGFLAHEAGHVFANLVQGNVPRFQPVWGFGFIPFFTIAPRIRCVEDKCYKHDGEEFWSGPRGKLAITSAGFHVQHFTDEIVLSRAPNLRHRYAPFRKGLLAFNTLLSVGYALAAMTHIENPQGDVSRSAVLIGIPRELYAAMLLVPAGLDLYRYFVPDSRWAPWVSRGSKTAFVGIVLTL